jgi:type II secretion system protein G
MNNASPLDEFFLISFPCESLQAAHPGRPFLLKTRSSDNGIQPASRPGRLSCLWPSRFSQELATHSDFEADLKSKNQAAEMPRRRGQRVRDGSIVRAFSCLRRCCPAMTGATSYLVVVVVVLVELWLLPPPQAARQTAAATTAAPIASVVGPMAIPSAAGPAAPPAGRGEGDVPPEEPSEFPLPDPALPEFWAYAIGAEARSAATAIVAIQVRMFIPRSCSHTLSKFEATRHSIRGRASRFIWLSRLPGHYPSSADGLRALVAKPARDRNWHGPYLDRSDGIIDPWGRPYLYTPPSNGSAAVIMSFGADGKPGGSDEDQDVTSVH